MPQPTEPEEERIPTGRIVFYASPLLGVFFANGLIGLYLLKFATDVLLVAPVAIGALLLAANVWDAVSDPPVGHLSDRTRTRFGRRRPWFMASALPMALCAVALWSPPDALDARGMIVWLAVALLLYRTFYTTFRVPHLALGAELSRGYHDRTRVFGVMQAVENLGFVFAAFGLAWIENAEAPREAGAQLALAMGAAIFVLVLAAGVGLRERSEFQGRGRTGSFRAFREVLANPHARILVAIFFLEQLGFSALVALLPYLSDYVLGTPGRTFLYVLAALAAITLSIPLWVVVSRRFGKLPVWRLSIVGKLLTFGSMWFLGPGDQLGMYVAVALFGAFQGCGAVVGPSLKADVVDWDEAQQGERKEGAYFATWNFAQKSASGVAGWMIGTALSATGFEPNVEQSETALTGIRALASLWPFALHVVALVLVWRFSLDEAVHREARRLAGRFEAGAGEN